jgi:UDP-hydrolysing UDP-N-acetyl-D-glucosamine 2-epimerase
VIGFGQVYAKAKLDLLIVLGDRFEMHAAVAAALPFNLPVAHIHGGELTEGAIDDSFRHSITKMSHLHFVTTEAYAKRVIQMGEEPWRVTVSGALSLDGVSDFKYISKKDLAKSLGIQFTEPIVLATYHPVTLQVDQVQEQMNEFLEALDDFQGTLIFTYPNADTGGRGMIPLLMDFVNNKNNAFLFQNLGRTRYFSLMKFSAAMIGNSSSGIIEAPSFGLPVVNIGIRQLGRIRGDNVIDVDCMKKDIKNALQKALSKDFKESIKNSANPHGDGHAAEKIIKKIKEMDNKKELLHKRFYDQ